MTQTTTEKRQWSELLADPWALTEAAMAYGIDAWQRTILFADIEREVGDQYRQKLREGSPGVLNFTSEPILSGLDLPRPTNYRLVRITPPDGNVVYETRRPFVVIDPRAGHGPGIGGFKPDSEIGAALKAGHPCYFVGFLPDPVPGQTVEDVMRCFAAFVEHVAQLHPGSEGKPAVIGNCQAGWQLLMAASVWPELFGPLIVAGTPLSYWAGDNPMRYAGGLLGGSWLTALTSDMGAGRFDGAWLVQNFENLDPANTLWVKQYNVYAKVDTERERYVGFEKYWGGYIFLNDVEMQYIVDNLFIGNKLSTAQLLTSDGLRVDLRNIRSPIIVFCSYGDNISPPPQALGWITDLYDSDEDVLSNDQTIVYTTHDSIGHLGIFVSSSVGQKEHRKFASLIDQIDLFPAGIYRATVSATPENDPDVTDPYLMSVRRSGVGEVREIVRPDPESDRRFAAAARVSEINLALYRNTLQPWVRAFATSYSARWLQTLHPLRMSFESWSSDHPLGAEVRELAAEIGDKRQPVPSDNPFLQMQKDFSDALVHFLDRYRDHRDEIYALSFDLMFGSPWLKALAGQSLADDRPARSHPGGTPEHRRMVQASMAGLEAKVEQGGLLEASLRALFHVLKHRGGVDERLYHRAARLWDDPEMPGPRQAEFRVLVREQALLLSHMGDKAIKAIPALLEGSDAEHIEKAALAIGELVRLDDEALPEAAANALAYVTGFFEQAALHARTTAQREASPNPASTEKPSMPPENQTGGSEPASDNSAARRTPNSRGRARKRQN